MKETVSALFTSRPIAETAIRHLAHMGFGLDRLFVPTEDPDEDVSGRFTITVIAEDVNERRRAHDVLAGYLALDQREQVRAEAETA